VIIARRFAMRITTALNDKGVGNNNCSSMSNVGRQRV
jgi:hypothetical protein